MRFLNCPLFSTLSATQNQASGIVECSLIFQASVQITTAGNAAGSAQLQVSNDIPPAGDLGPFTPTHWSNLGSAITFSGASVNLIPKTDISYRWLRMTLTSTSPPVQEIDTVADVGSIVFGTQQLLFTGGPADGGLITLKFSGTSIILDPATDDAASFQTALQAISGYSTATVSGDWTAGFDIDMGVYPDPAVGTIFANTLTNAAAPVAAAFTNTPGVFTSTLNNKYFLASDSGSVHKYMLWLNVSGHGSAPTPPTGYIAEAVAISSGATAAAVATALASVLNGLAGFSSAVIATNRVRLSNLTVGPFIPAADGAAATGFTFAVTTAGTILANLKTLGS